MVVCLASVVLAMKLSARTFGADISRRCAESMCRSSEPLEPSYAKQCAAVLWKTLGRGLKFGVCNCRLMDGDV
jgi:hypothetical protein